MPHLQNVAVVIPFFQRQKGLLVNCVQSVISQKGVDRLQVIIIDDESPVLASEELKEILIHHPNISVFRQVNAGPGAARNRGLDNVREDTEYVAFIDSDDQWEASFLEDALYAFDRGCDLFFGNTRRYDIEKTRFEWTAESGRILKPSDHTVIDSQRGLYEYSGDFFDFAIFRSSIVSTSTLMYRFAKFPSMRFNQNLFNGQDRLFKLLISKQANKVAFSMRVCANEGRGVNIFDNSRWGSEKSLNLILNYIKLSKCIIEEVSMTEAQAGYIQSQLRETRYSFTVTILHLLKNSIRIDWRVVGKTFVADPLLIMRIIPDIFRVAFRKMGATT